MQSNGITWTVIDAPQLRVIYGPKVATQVGGIILILESAEAAKTERTQFETALPAEEIRAKKDRAF